MLILSNVYIFFRTIPTSKLSTSKLEVLILYKVNSTLIKICITKSKVEASSGISRFGLVVLVVENF